jgi:hypothetical protein
MWGWLVLLALGYFVWDGFIPREISADQRKAVHATASVISPGRVDYRHYPIDPNYLYLAVYLDNKSTSIIRESISIRRCGKTMAKKEYNSKHCNVNQVAWPAYESL